MLRLLLNIYIILLFCAITSAQSKLLTQIDSIKKIETPKDRINQFKNLLKKQDSIENNLDLDKIYVGMARAYLKTEHIDSTVFYSQKAINLKKLEAKKDVNTLNDYRYLLSLGYFHLGESKKRHNTLLTIIRSTGNGYHIYRAYKDLSRIERVKGDFYKSLLYLNKALSNPESLGKLKYELGIRLLIITTYAQKYANNFRENKEVNDLNILKEHWRIIEQQFANAGIKKKKHIYDMYNNLAVSFDAFGELDTSLELYTKAKDFYLSKGFKYEGYTSLMNIGIIYSRQQKFQKANTCFEKTLQETTNNELKALVYDNMGYYLNTDSAKKKIPFFKKAIRTSLKKKTTLEENFDLPELKTIEESDYSQDVLVYLIDLAAHQVKAYKQESNKVYLYNAKKTLMLVDKLVSLIRHDSTSEQSKLFWIEKGVDTYMLAVEVCYLLKDTNLAFYFMEKNKALLLQESIKTKQAKFNLNIPKSTIAKEYNLFYKRLHSFKNLQETPDDSSAKQSFRKNDEKYLGFMDSLRQHYPNYVKIKKDVEITDLKNVTPKNNCFVEYILDNNKGYGLFYNGTETLFFEIPNVPKLQKDIAQLQKYFTSSVLSKKEKIALQELSFSVFNTLFPFPNAKEKLNQRKLTIIPDYRLQTFPFEALTTSNNTTLSESYLVHFSEIVYLQSFSLFDQIKQNNNTPNKKLLTVIPRQFKHLNLPELTGSESTIQFSSQIKNSKVLSNDQATRTNFIKHLNDYEIIHLNTHAGLDSISQPWIAFYDDKIPLHELYGLENQAELVVLDACETNSGNLAMGEGVISLSRGFFFDGAQSVIASLWYVNEKAGNTILQEFYTQMQKGTSKSKALQLAKINYIKNHHFSEALPFYWAAFTLTGKTDTIILEVKSTSIYFTVAILILLPILILLFIKKKKSPRGLIL
ncbi:CHAT domain-containing protein [Tenacibaculum xiamenense]|uniref:CHAT domain-containing protein n=1 Tax=Tenacibaculum xiamenense TaxID=1261553 RepID=UPI003894EBB2